MKQPFAEAMKLREADRRQAQQRQPRKRPADDCSSQPTFTRQCFLGYKDDG
jgi:hypothetical protein